MDLMCPPPLDNYEFYNPKSQMFDSVCVCVCELEVLIPYSWASFLGFCELARDLFVEPSGTLDFCILGICRLDGVHLFSWVSRKYA